MVVNSALSRRHGDGRPVPGAVLQGGRQPHRPRPDGGEQQCAALQGCVLQCSLQVGSDEMLIGRAGYLTGCLWLQVKLCCWSPFSASVTWSHSLTLSDNSVISELTKLIHILFLQALQQQSLHARLGSLLTEFN